MILVTGGAGYIGSHVNLVLNEAGYETVVLDDMSLGHEELVVRGRLVQGSVGDRELLRSIFSENPIDAVVHLAGSTDVDESIEKPSDYYRNNVANTLTLLDAMREYGIDRIIFSSTSCVYSDQLSGLIAEDAVLNPICPYGRNKLMIEQILDDFRAAYGLQYVVFRYFNAAGADLQGRIGEWHEPEVHLIPVMLDVATGRRSDIHIFGTDYPTRDGTCVRDYIHVLDIAHAHLRVIRYLSDGGDSTVFNLGYGRGYSVREVIEMAREITGKKIPAIPSDRRKGDVAESIANCSKVANILDWQPRFDDLKTIIASAWAWHQKLNEIQKV